MVDRALGRILDGHDTEVGDAAFNLVKHLVDGGQRQGAHRCAKLFEHGGLGERTLGAEKSHFERFLLRETGRHDLAKQPNDLLVTQGTLVALERLAQDLGLALGSVEIDGLARSGLGDADQLCKPRALVEQTLNARIDSVYRLTDGRQIDARGCHTGFRLRVRLRVFCFTGWHGHP